MIVASVMYPKTEESTFNFEYYLQKHVPLVRARFGECGLFDVRLTRGSAMKDGAAPIYALICDLVFPTLQHLQNALSKHGAEVIADVPKYTNVQPIIQIGESL